MPKEVGLRLNLNSMSVTKNFHIPFATVEYGGNVAYMETNLKNPSSTKRGPGRYHKQGYKKPKK